MFRIGFTGILTALLLGGCSSSMRVATQLPSKEDKKVIEMEMPSLLPHFGETDWRGGILGQLSRPLGTDSYRASSWDRSGGNADARPIPSGGKLTLAELEGPGVVTHIWCTVAAEEYYSRKLILRAWWDGAEEPSIEAPLGDFFAVGHGIDRPVNSLPIRVTSDGRARNCFWPMPFHKSARFEIENQGAETVRSFYYYIDYKRVPSLPNDELYFHARYRQEWPCPKIDLQGINLDGAQNYVILETEGRGTYVGCNLSITNNAPGWWGEGDDFFWIDGKTEPRLNGTGSEDYFCDAWGMREIDGLFYGCPLFSGLKLGDVCTVYRFHIADPIPFKKSLKFSIEHGHANDRSDNFSSVAYWYQDRPFTNKNKVFFVPPVEERVSNQAKATLELPQAVARILAERKAGRLDKAAQIADAFIQKFPDSVSSQQMAILTAYDKQALGKDSEAVELFTQVADTWPDSDAGQVAKAELWRRAGERRAMISITCDNAYTLYLDGVELGSGNDLRTLRTYQTLLMPGKHVLAVEAKNRRGTCGLVAAIRSGDLSLESDSTWKVSREPGELWKNTEYDDSGWQNATVHGQGFDSEYYSQRTFGLPGIPEQAGWIWADENSRDGDVVYFRKVLEVVE